MMPVIHRLPILILNPFSRCNCRCRMCDIWKRTEPELISRHALERHLESLEGYGLQWVVVSGGEPLMHPDISGLCAVLRARRLRVTILTAGLLLERHAGPLAAYVDDLIVSLDGPPPVHDFIRRVDGAFTKLAAGVRAVRTIRPDFPVAARCTVQKANHTHLSEAVATALDLGLNSISFLAADLHSAAFHRPQGWPLGHQQEIALSREQIPALEAETEALIDSGKCGKFIPETPQKLRRIVHHFRAHLGLSAPTAPRCNAPWVSAVIEADGALRPCFFHPSVGQVAPGLSAADVLNGPQAIAFRSTLNVDANPICRRCVCSLHLQ